MFCPSAVSSELVFAAVVMLYFYGFLFHKWVPLLVSFGEQLPTRYTQFSFSDFNLKTRNEKRTTNLQPETNLLLT